MSVSTKRFLLRAAMVATAPFLLVTCAWCLFLLNTVNPMQLAFVTEFEIENQTQQPVWVTPIGTRQSGDKSVLPQFATEFPAIPDWRSRDQQIDPGERIRIYYDWDDHNFSDIAIRDSAGVVRNLVVDAEAPTDAYSANAANLYRIKNIQALPMASPGIASAIAPKPHSFMFWLSAVSGLVAPFLFAWLRRRLRELNAKSDNALA